MQYVVCTMKCFFFRNNNMLVHNTFTATADNNTLAAAREIEKSDLWNCIKKLYVGHFFCLLLVQCSNVFNTFFNVIRCSRACKYNMWQKIKEKSCLVQRRLHKFINDFGGSLHVTAQINIWTLYTTVSFFLFNQTAFLLSSIVGTTKAKCNLNWYYKSLRHENSLGSIHFHIWIT